MSGEQKSKPAQIKKISEIKKIKQVYLVKVRNDTKASNGEKLYRIRKGLSHPQCPALNAKF